MLLALLFLLAASCTNDIDKVRFFDRKTLPNQSIKDAHITRSSSGHVQMVLDAKVIEKYTEPEEKTLYPQGVAIDFLNEDGSKKAHMWAQYAEDLTARNLMQARDSVVIVDFGSGDTVYLKNLTWNKDEHRIYSNNLLRSVNGQRLTYGDGFESDDNFEHPQILHQRGTIEWKETAE